MVLPKIAMPLLLTGLRNSRRNIVEPLAAANWDFISIDYADIFGW
jgi:hypothetical protein